MANVKVSQLPAAGEITGAELVPVVQGGATVKATVAAMTASKVSGVTAVAPLSSSGGASPEISLSGTVPVNKGGTGQTSYTDGQLLIGNSAGNTLTKATLTAGAGVTITNGPGSVTIEAGGLPEMIVVTGTTQTAEAGKHYVLTNASATTVTLPASPSPGDVVWVTVANGLSTNVIARNGSVIMGLAEDMTLNSPHASAQLRYVNAPKGWRLL